MASGCFLIFFVILSFNNPRAIDSIVQVSASEVNVHGGKGVINLYVTIKDGYHIQSHVVDDEFLVPTTIELQDSGVVSVLAMKFPPGKKFKLEGSSDYLSVYDENLTI